MKTKSTGYRDRRGNPIHYGDTVLMGVSSPWDDQVPVYLHFVIKRLYGGIWMEGVESNFADDFLKDNAKDCEITRRVEPRMEEANQQGTKRPCAAPTRRRHTGARRG